MSRLSLGFAAALLAAATSAPAGAQADWSDLQPTAIDGLKVATKCLQKSQGPATFYVRLVNATDAPLSGWYSVTNNGTEGPHRTFTVKPHGGTMQPGPVPSCIGSTVNVGQ